MGSPPFVEAQLGAIRSFRVSALLGLLGLATSCSGATVTGPIDRISGTWISAIPGVDIPQVLYEASGIKVEITGATLVIGADRTYQFKGQFRVTRGAAVANPEWLSAGVAQHLSAFTESRAISTLEFDLTESGSTPVTVLTAVYHEQACGYVGVCLHSGKWISISGTLPSSVVDIPGQKLRIDAYDLVRP